MAPPKRAGPLARAAAVGVIIVGLLAVVGVCYLLKRPALQVYWAIYARMRDSWKTSSVPLTLIWKHGSPITQPLTKGN
jgi:hypothetical protein